MIYKTEFFWLVDFKGKNNINLHNEQIKILAYTIYKNKVLSILFPFLKLTNREIKLIQTLREGKEIQGYIIDKNKYLKVFIFEGLHWCISV